MCLNLLFCLSIKSLIFCIIFLMFFSTFVNIYFVVLGQLLATTKISNPVYYRINSSVENNSSLHW